MYMRICVGLVVALAAASAACSSGNGGTRTDAGDARAVDEGGSDRPAAADAAGEGRPDGARDVTAEDAGGTVDTGNVGDVGGAADRAETGNAGDVADAADGSNAPDAQDASAAGDAGVDSGPLDPATCPVGASDGCCPRLTRGGTDPDCPSLGCTLALGAPILLDDLATYQKSGTGVAWTGRELVLARLDYRPVQTTPGAQYQDYDVLVERRDANGNVLGSPVRHPDLNMSPSPYGPGSLAFEPTSRSLLYAYQANEVSRVVNLDETGQERWAMGGVTACTDRTARVQAFAVPGRFVFGGDNYTCNFPGDRHNEVQAWRPDGTKLPSMPTFNKVIATPGYDGVYACNGDCSQVFTYYTNGSGQPFARVYDLEHDVLGAPVAANGVLYGGVNGQAAAFDGARYFVLSNDYTGANVSQAHFRFFDPGSGSLTNYTTTENINLEGFTGTMIWTGDGFVAAMALYPFGSVTLAPRTAARIHIWHLAPDGTLRQSFDLEAHQGVLPDLALLPGKIAVTWVRSDTMTEQRYLSFLSCAN
jgi:hypothetical protein